MPLGQLGPLILQTASTGYYAAVPGALIVPRMTFSLSLSLFFSFSFLPLSLFPLSIPLFRSLSHSLFISCSLSLFSLSFSFFLSLYLSFFLFLSSFLSFSLRFRPKKGLDGGPSFPNLFDAEKEENTKRDTK